MERGNIPRASVVNFPSPREIASVIGNGIAVPLHNGQKTCRLGGA